MKRVLAIVMASAFVAAPVWLSANGQQMETRSNWREINEGATFQPFGVWQKAQFGATSMINPRTAENARVLYSYEPRNLVGKGANLESAAIVKASPDSSTLRPVPEEEASKVTTAIAAGNEISDDYRVLSIENVEGANPQEVIAWPGQ